MTRLIFSFWLMFLVPVHASAQDIGVKLSEMPIGSWWVTKSGSATTMQILKKRQGNKFTVDFVDPKNPNGPRSARDVRDANGNVLKRVEKSGLTTVYRPHNCQRVIGRCEFTTKQSGSGATRQGQTAQMVRTTKTKGNGFTFEQVIVTEGKGLHVQSGTVVSLDRFGIVERAKGKSGFKKKRFSTRKIKSSWD